MKKILNTLLIAAAVIFIDQLSKFLIISSATDLIHKNAGIAFSLPIYGNIVLAAAYIALAAILFFAYKTFDFSKKISQLALGFIFGGAISNIIDRIVHGAVIDFIDLKIWPVFNIADICITAGILAIIVFYDKIKSEINRRGIRRISDEPLKNPRR